MTNHCSCEDGGSDCECRKCKKPLEAGTGKEMDSSPEPPEGMQSSFHLDFILVSPIHFRGLPWWLRW